MIERLHELNFPCNTTYRLTVIKAVVVALRMQIRNQLSNTEEESILSSPSYKSGFVNAKTAPSLQSGKLRWQNLKTGSNASSLYAI